MVSRFAERLGADRRDCEGKRRDDEDCKESKVYPATDTKYVPLGKPHMPISDVGAPQHVRCGFIQLIGTPDFFKTRH